VKEVITDSQHHYLALSIFISARFCFSVLLAQKRERKFTCILVDSKSINQSVTCIDNENNKTNVTHMTALPKFV